jgi:hypothetical protein
MRFRNGNYTENRSPKVAFVILFSITNTVTAKRSETTTRVFVEAASMTHVFLRACARVPANYARHHDLQDTTPPGRCDGEACWRIWVLSRLRTAWYLRPGAGSRAKSPVVKGKRRCRMHGSARLGSAEGRAQRELSARVLHRRGDRRAPSDEGSSS